jgi:hypothetical protein
MEIYVENNFLAPGGTQVPIGVVSIYEPRAVFSLDASRRLRGSFWMTKGGEVQLNNLGPASYEIYDSDGNLVAGISESGISANVSGLYETQPVLATGLVDLTHYTALVSIVFESVIRRAYIGLVIGE